MTLIEKQVELAQAIVDTGLVTKVYHSCEIITDRSKGRLYAAFPRGKEYVPVAIDDTSELFAYIRYNGDVPTTPLGVGSCGRYYEAQVPLRVVFFNDYEKRDFDLLEAKLLGFTMKQNVTLTRIINDKFRLFREESDLGSPNLDGAVFYRAFDILVKILLLPDDCLNAECKSYANPLCK